MTTLGHRIASIRRDLGLSRAELARRAGLSVDVLAAIEKATGRPESRVLSRIAKALCVSAIRFFEEVDLVGRWRVQHDGSRK